MVLLAVGALVYWLLHRNEESTDDAYTDGDTVTVAAKVSGYVSELSIGDNVYVHQGDRLLHIDPRDLAAARDQARAQLGLAQSNLRSAEVALARVRYPAQLAEAQAKRETAEAALSRAKRMAAFGQLSRLRDGKAARTDELSLNGPGASSRR